MAFIDGNWRDWLSVTILWLLQALCEIYAGKMTVACEAGLRDDGLVDVVCLIAVFYDA